MLKERKGVRKWRATKEREKRTQLEEVTAPVDGVAHGEEAVVLEDGGHVLWGEKRGKRKKGRSGMAGQATGVGSAREVSRVFRKSQ